MKQRIFALLLLLLIVSTATAQPRPNSPVASKYLEEDLKAVLSSGSVVDNVYTNKHIGFALKLPQPPCDPKLNDSVGQGIPFAIVLRCIHYVQGMVGMYTITISVDYVANNPNVHTTAEYVSWMRHNLERDPKQHTVRAEESRRMAGLDFVEIVMSDDLDRGGKYYQAAACTRLDKYLICFEAEAPTPEEAQAILELDGKLEVAHQELANDALKPATPSTIDILSDPMGVDFGPYLSRVQQKVRDNWYTVIPQVARPPEMKQGAVGIDFVVLKDGSISGMKLTRKSGDVALDRAAWWGITASDPFPPLPSEFRGSYLALRLHFYYNPERGEVW